MLFLSLFILGFSSLVSQIVMTRELMVSFYGNEFFIGWLLFGWLFWVGTGSVLIKSSQRLLRGLPLLLTCHLLVALLVPLSIFWIRLSKSLFTGAAGQIPDLMPAVLVSFFAVRRHLISLAKAGLCAKCQQQVLVHGHQHSNSALNLSNRLPFFQRCTGTFRTDTGKFSTS